MMAPMEVFSEAAAFEETLRRFVAVRCVDASSRRAAREFLDSLDDIGRGMLERWLASQVERIVYEEIQRIRPRSGPIESGATHPVVRPKAAARQSAAASFGAAVEGFTRGDVEALSDFRLIYHVHGVEKRLGEMTGNDHLEVASTFQAIGASSLLLAAIHRRIGRALGGRRTQEAFTESEYRQVFAHSFRDSDEPGCMEALQLEPPLKGLPA